MKKYTAPRPAETRHAGQRHPGLDPGPDPASHPFPSLRARPAISL